MNQKPNNKPVNPLILALLLVSGVFIGLSFNWNGGGSPKAANKWSRFLSFLNQDYVDQVNVDSLVGVSMSQVLSHLDPHSVYVEKEKNAEDDERFKGQFYGIGVQFFLFEDTVQVLQVIDESPAKAAGILKGDKLLISDSDTLFGKSLSSEGVRDFIKGQKGTKVKLAIRRNNELKTIVVERGRVPIKSVPVHYLLDSTKGYVKVSRFAETTADEFDQVLNEWRENGVKKYIIDLRNNPGGLLGQAVEVIGNFLPKNKLILYTQGRNRPKKEYNNDYDGQYRDSEVCILINSGSASASEIVAGALQDHDQATIIGQRSFGKGLVQERYRYDDGSEVRLTTSRYYTPSGRCIQRDYKEGVQSYYKDHYDIRSLADTSANLVGDTTKVYYTASGRKVYGGGGIYPDFYIVDSVDIPEDKIIEEIYLNRTILNWSMAYLAKERSNLDELGLKEFVQSFEFNEKDLAAMLEVESVPELSQEVKEYLFWQMKLEIAQKNWSTKGLLMMVNSNDPYLLKAKSILGKH